MDCRFFNASFIRKVSFSALAATSLVASVISHAAPIDLVKNGSFDLTSGYGQIGYNVSVADWTTHGYSFIFQQGTGDTVGAKSMYGGAFTVWGLNNGGANALAVSHDGGNFIGADGSWDVDPITQTIDGLVAGKNYTLSFEWAGAQQYGFTGATTEQWLVNLGSDPSTQQATGTYHDVSHGSSTWMQESMNFTATSTSEVLSFLAAGTPEGEPPFSLLDGVSLVESRGALPKDGVVPEPSSWQMFLTGLGAIAFLVRRYRRNA